MEESSESKGLKISTHVSQIVSGAEELIELIFQLKLLVVFSDLESLQRYKDEEKEILESEIALKRTEVLKNFNRKLIVGVKEIDIGSESDVGDEDVIEVRE